MYPSPISSHTVSGSSTPLTGGSGAIPFHHAMSPSTYLHEGIGMAPRSQNSFSCSSSNMYQDPKPDLFQGMSQASHVFREIISPDRNALRNQFGQPGHGDLREFYDGQPFMADHLSQQLPQGSWGVKPYSGLESKHPNDWSY